MKSTFLDTSGLIAVVNSDDQWNSKAIAVWQDLINSNSILITTSLVLVEIADGLSRIKHRPLAIQIVEAMRGSDLVEIIQSTDELESRAWNFFKDRGDKEWGMTDCVSMILMQDLGIEEAFSADSHFTQAGFRILIE